MLPAMSKLLDVALRAMELAENAMDRVREARGKPRRKLDHVPDPPGNASAPTAKAPAPAPAVAVAAAVKEPEKPLGDLSIAVQVFGRRTCQWSGRVILLLQDRQIEHVFTNLDDEPTPELELRLVRETKQNTVPYVYLRGEFIGGYNALSEIERLGVLEERLLPPSQREAHRGRIRIVVPERGPEDLPPGR
jgi:glutaredoxin